MSNNFNISIFNIKNYNTLKTHLVHYCILDKIFENVVRKRKTYWIYLPLNTSSFSSITSALISSVFNDITLSASLQIISPK